MVYSWRKIFTNLGITQCAPHIPQINFPQCLPVLLHQLTPTLKHLCLCFSAVDSDRVLASLPYFRSFEQNLPCLLNIVPYNFCFDNLLSYRERKIELLNISLHGVLPSQELKILLSFPHKGLIPSLSFILKHFQFYLSFQIQVAEAGIRVLRRNCLIQMRKKNNFLIIKHSNLVFLL